MSENIDELRNMLVTFRVSELQMLLGFAGRNKSGRKTELQQRALELLRVRSHPIHQKIRDLYKTIQQSGNTLNQVPPSTPSPGNKDLNMPQNAGNVPRNTATVHPYNIDGRQMTSRQPSMFNQNVYNPYPQYAAQQKAQAGSGGSSATGPHSYPVHPDVKFRRLPFYDILSDLLKPSTLVPQSSQRMQEATFYFHLTPQQATDIASSRDIRPGVKCDYVKQVQLRFCLLETTCEQDDCFPPNVIVKVNTKPCPLPVPIPTNKPGVEPKRPPRPVNITPMVKLSPIVANMITVQWAPDYGRGYAISVALVQKLTSQDLLQRLKAKGAKHSDHTRGLIKEKLKEDADSEITTTCLRVSLICPLGKMRMSTPSRAITCNHLQCFDASLFLQMNERKPTWCCPVCDKPALYDNLVIDGYFQEVLASSALPSDLNEIQLNKDGSWSAQVADRKAFKSERVPLDDSVEIIDDVEVVGTTTATSSTDKSKDEKSKEKVVDLTVSDSDDDEPLAKRRAIPPKPDSTIKFSGIKIPKTSTERSRESRARRALLKEKSATKTAAQRNREYRARKKTLRNASANIEGLPQESTSLLDSRHLPAANPGTPQPSTSKGVSDILSNFTSQTSDQAGPIQRHVENGEESIVVQADVHYGNSSQRVVNPAVTRKPVKSCAQRSREYRQRRNKAMEALNAIDIQRPVVSSVTDVSSNIESDMQIDPVQMSQSVEMDVENNISTTSAVRRQSTSTQNS